MFEFERSGSNKVETIALQQSAAQSLPPASQRALLFWGEHCIECAAPACFQSCDLYSPTPAGKCRRFEGGIVPNPSLGSTYGPAAEIRFRRWGKLEARGHGTLMPSGQVRLAERLLRCLAVISSELGPVLAKVSKDVRWLSSMEALHKRINTWLQLHQNDLNLPDALHVEILNPGTAPVELVLSVSVDKVRLKRMLGSEQLPHPVGLRMTAAPGLSTHQIPCESMREIFLSRLPFNISISPANDSTPHLIFRTLELVSYRKARAGKSKHVRPVSRPSIKCVVFDLDNTLWDGVLLEGAVNLRNGVRKLFNHLDERGILISIASKNAKDDAIHKLQEFDLLQYVVCPQIGWIPKSEAVQQIARSLNIGRDTLLFIDDNPFERAEVSGALPDVEVLPDSEIPNLAKHTRLRGAVTAESRSRRKMYQEAAAREEVAAVYGDNYLDFLRSCEMVATIRKDEKEDFDRICELVQRTNQLNFSGRKYSRAEITDLLTDPHQDRLVIACSDRFGSYGTVGFCLSHRVGNTVVVDDFMLSCRVQGKFVEQALFWYLTQSSGPQANAIEVNFKRTERNRAAEMVLEKLGFEMNSESKFCRKVSPGDLAVDFMKVVT